MMRWGGYGLGKSVLIGKHVYSSRMILHDIGRCIPMLPFTLIGTHRVISSLRFGCNSVCQEKNTCSKMSIDTNILSIRNHYEQ